MCAHARTHARTPHTHTHTHTHTYIYEYNIVNAYKYVCVFSLLYNYVDSTYLNVLEHLYQLINNLKYFYLFLL